MAGIAMDYVLAGECRSAFGVHANPGVFGCQTVFSPTISGTDTNRNVRQTLNEFKQLIQRQAAQIQQQQREMDELRQGRSLPLQWYGYEQESTLYLKLGNATFTPGGLG